MEIMPIASGSSGNAYRVTDGETPLLLDAGIPIRAIQIALDFRLRALGGCFITHCHGDHSKAARDLMRLGVDVYTGRGTVEACGLQGHRIHISKSFEENTFPFHHRHSRFRPDVPQSQDRRAVRNYRHRVPPPGKLIALADILLNLKTRLGNSRRIGKA